MMEWNARPPQEFLLECWEYQMRYGSRYLNRYWWEPGLYFRIFRARRVVGRPPMLNIGNGCYYMMKAWDPRRIWFSTRGRLWIGSWVLVRKKDTGSLELCEWQENWI